MLILFVMGATVIFVIGAIVVDIGLWVTERRNAQAAADLAALAAATQLRNADPNADATAKGMDYAKRNGYDPADPDITVSVQPSYQDDPDQVQVTIDEKGGSLFAGIFGINSMNVGATAVAAYGQGLQGPDIALFANSGNCNAGESLDIQAQHLSVDGSTHSNARLFVDGPQDDFVGPVTWTCPNGFTNGHANNSFQPAPTMVSNRPAPINLTWAEIEPSCTHLFTDPVKIVDNDNSLWVGNNPNTGRLLPGVICGTGDLVLTRGSTQGHVTLAAQGKITISGADNQLQWADILAGTPLRQLLIYSSSVGDPAIEINAPGGTYTGYIHAPDSRVSIDGSHTGSALFFLEGSIVASTIRISGNWFELHGAGLPGPEGPPEINLVD